MKVLAEVCIVPIGIGVSVSQQVAQCEKIFAEAGLKAELHAYGTNLEGEYDDVMAAIKRCHQTLHSDGVPRLFTTVKLGTRTDRDQTLADKVDSVNRKLRPPAGD
ncbi:MTH1187 family thiamine-binding protein [Planctomycetales bacterium ZRK34]|nr:MTH1187 family thiamine-binding protein [Planctomycetales bacterium ZRK34]